MSLMPRSGAAKRPLKKRTLGTKKRLVTDDVIKPSLVEPVVPAAPKRQGFSSLKQGHLYQYTGAGGGSAGIIMIEGVGGLYATATLNGRRFPIYGQSGGPNEWFTPATPEEEQAYQVQKEEAARKNPGVFLTSKGSCGASGSDPEIFAVDENGAVIPSWLFLPPKPKGPLYGIVPHTDGFQAEFTTEAGTCHQSLSYEFRSGLIRVLNAALAVNPLARLSYQCVVEVPPALLASETDEHLGLGCSPSLNIYDEPPLDVPNPRDLPVRFAGCHIHQGIGAQPEKTLKATVKTMDAILGPVMTSMFRGLEDPRRREFYGRAGEYRLPAHGLEYRVPSSVTLCSPVTYHLVFDIGRMASHMARMGKAFVWRADESMVRRAINELDMDCADAILADNTAMLDAMLYTLYGSSKDIAKDIILKGVSSVLDVSDMQVNWGIETVEKRHNTTFVMNAGYSYQVSGAQRQK